MTVELPELGDVSTLRLARGWYEVDPDSDHRNAIQAALAEGSTWVSELFGSRLGFGTAGIRGPLGAGPGAMNRVLVRVVAAGVAAFVRERGGSKVVVGFDARHGSHNFAIDIARVLAAKGMQTYLFEHQVPTPVLAFAVRHLAADGGIMVTASHNPATDNGLKIYGPGGALVSAPDDTALAAHILSTQLLHERELVRESDVRINHLGDAVIEAYLDAICAPYVGASKLKVAYTPIHGVGGDIVAAALARAGFGPPLVVASQRDPDPDFPTAPFPNPEEPGVLDPLVTLASAEGAEVALASDPDADRLAVVVPDGASWRVLSGDEVGCLLAEYLLGADEASPRPQLVLNTIVSSRLLGLIASDHGADARRTLTGFKWMMSEALSPQWQDTDVVIAYEEALGYSIGSTVRDKDGVSAALAVAALVSDLKAQGLTLLDALDALHRRHGVHVSGQRALRFGTTGPSAAQVMDFLRSVPLPELAGQTVHEVVDLASGESMPATDGLIIHLDNAWLAVRPSGTEAKLKCYGEVWDEPVEGPAELRDSRATAHQKLGRLLDALCALGADPERHETAQRLAADPQSVGTDARDEAAALFDGRPTSLAFEDALRLTVRAIDLTSLAGDDTDGRVRALCAQARRPDPADSTVGPTAAVCVYPNLVPTAVELTRRTGVAVASVAGAFPSGLSSLEVRLADIDDAIAAGADEVDVVINRSALLMGDHATVLAELKAMRGRMDGCAMKVILETCELASAEAIEHATRLAIEGGAEWVKTSTGKAAAGADPLGVFTMAQVVAEHVAKGGDPVGIKVSGGVRTADDALGYLAIVEAVLGPEWLDPARVRFGASGLLTAVVNALH